MNADSAFLFKGPSSTGSDRAVGLAPDLESALLEGLEDAPDPDSFEDDDRADFEPDATVSAATLFEAGDYQEADDLAPPPASDRAPSTEPDPPRPSYFEDTLAGEPPDDAPEPAASSSDEDAENFEDGTAPGPAPFFEADGYEEADDRAPVPAPDRTRSTEPDPPRPSYFEDTLAGEPPDDAPEPAASSSDEGAENFEDGVDSESAHFFEGDDYEDSDDRAPPPAPDRTPSTEPDPPRASDFEGALLEGLADAPEPPELEAFPEDEGAENGADPGPAPFFETDGPGEPAAPVRPPIPDWSPPPEADFEQTLAGPRADSFDTPGFLEDGSATDNRTGAPADRPGPFSTDGQTGTYEDLPGQTGLPLPDWSPPTEPDLERTLVEGLTDAAEPYSYVPGAGAGGLDHDTTAPPPSEPSGHGPRADQSPPSLADWDSPQEPDVERALLAGLADAPDPGEELPDDAEVAELDPDPGFDAASLEEPFEEPSGAAFGALPEENLPPEEAAAPGPAARVGPFAAAGGEAAALAFATDPETESALREGLSDRADPQVWPGGLRTAIEVISAGHSAPLIFADLDETPYPAGAIHELATVCEMGTVVIALGSDGTARFSREILLAGVSDYLVKPVTPAAVREAAARAARSESVEPAGGWSVGFAGTGGSGATTVAAATALVAAERGRYVSVLDLNRTFPALSFLLDVEPAAGLVELLSTVARASLHPEMVDSMRAERSDRIAVYGYPWSAIPPPLAPVWAVCELLVELQRRSHLVLIDGLDDPATRLALLALADVRVLVVEPTPDGAVQAAHLFERFGPMFDEEWPFVLVQNHTRGFKPAVGARVLNGAGVDAPADVVIPFEPSLPAVADRGWPRGRLPKSIQKSLEALVDRTLAGEAATAAPVFA